MSKKMLVFICAFILHNLFGVCQGQNIDSLLTLQHQADPQEKTYVQFDKTYYSPGETIWFKAYLFSGIDPSIASKNFYAELYDESGNLLDRKISPIIQSSSASSFTLSLKLLKKVLFFRAYTAAQMNSDTSFLFVKPIHIILPPGNAIAATPTVTPTKLPVIAFFPEGGDLVESLTSKMAFKSTDNSGLPLNISGTVTDNTGNKVADFTALHDGMGMFAITPETGKTYTANWKDGKGNLFNTKLPAAKPDGIVLQIIDQPKNKKFILQRTKETTENLKHLKIIGYMNQQVAYVANVDLSKVNVVQGTFPLEGMPSGIVQFTVFDNNNKPVAERISFINSHDYQCAANASLSEKNTGKRAQNILDITIEDTVLTNVSVSITDADLNEAAPLEDNIVSHLLLTGDLRGKVINPYYYFSATGDSVAMHLDLVMLTNGWRHYNWDNVFAGKLSVQKFRESNFIAMDGQLSSKAFQKAFTPALQLKGIIKTADSVTSFFSMPITKDGKVFEDSLIFYDKANLYFHFSDKKLAFSKSMLDINNGLIKSYAQVNMDKEAATLNLDTDIVDKINTTNILALKAAEKRNAAEHQLENVTIKASAKSDMDKMDKRYSSSMFINSNAIKFNVLDDKYAFASTSVFHYLRAKVAGLDVNIQSNGGLGDNVSLSWRGNRSIGGASSAPDLFLNEALTDIGQLGSVAMEDVAYIKLFRPGQTGVVTMSPNGAIIVYTKKGGDVSASENNVVDYVELQGYSSIKQFYMPDPSATDITDVRSTIYWNPNIFLDGQNKKVSFKFYNTDIAHRFKLTMEGINDAGKLVHVEKIID